MITSDDLLQAIADVNATTEDTNLYEFAGIEDDAIEKLMEKATGPMSIEDQTLMATGIVVALRAVKNRGENPDGE